MESKWRQNIPSLIGPNVANGLWYDGAFPIIVKLCAELITPLIRFGKVWTHLVSGRDFGTPFVAYLGRLDDLEPGVLTLRFLGFFPGKFPWGIPVETDRV